MSTEVKFVAGDLAVVLKPDGYSYVRVESSSVAGGLEVVEIDWLGAAYSFEEYTDGAYRCVDLVEHRLVTAASFRDALARASDDVGISSSTLRSLAGQLADERERDLVTVMLEALAKLDGCCMDVPEEREAVAAAMAAVAVEFYRVEGC